MIHTLVFAVAAAATPASGPAVSPERRALQSKVAAYFHAENDKFGGHRAYFLYSLAADGLNLIVNVHQRDWLAIPKQTRDLSVSQSKAWWEKNCANPHRHCVLGIYDDKGTAILATPKPAKK